MKNKLYVIWVLFSRFTLVLLCVACARWNFVQTHTNTSTEFTPYIQEFERLTKKKVNINVNFETLVHPVSGVCYYRLIGNEVSIDKTKWKYYTLNQRRMLVFHELSHCVCYTAHVEDETKNQVCSDNYMNPYLEDDYCIQIKECEYLEQLKKDCR